MQKILLFIGLMMVGTLRGSAQQNYVPNGDFEYYDACPSSYAQVSKISGWKPYTSGSPDYFNSCATFWGVKVPPNNYGTQPAASGQGYVGVYAANGPGEYKEYVSREIIPLTPGGEYEVSLSVSLSDSSDTAESDIGVFFFDKGPSFIFPDTTPPVKPQIIYTSYGYLEDKVGWMRLTQTFIADSAYKNIVIGSFKDSNSRTVFEPPPTGNFEPPYYYIDSIVVKLLDTFKVSFTDSVLCASDAIQVRYWTRLHTTPGTIATIQLSDAAGSFAQPVSIGTDTNTKGGLVICNIPSNIPSGTGYRIRAVSTHNNETSVDNGSDIKIINIDNLEATSNSPVCSNDTLRLMATQDTTGATYAWTGPGYGSVQQNPVLYNPVKANAGDYVLTAKIYRCTRSDTTTVVVLDGNRAHNVSATSNSPICENDTLLFQGMADAGPFVYTWAGPNSFAETGKETSLVAQDTTVSGEYVFSVTDKECIVSDTMHAIVKPNPPKPVLSSNSPLNTYGMLFLAFENPAQGATISWTGPSGFTSSTPKPVIGNLSAIQSGKYILTTDLNGCSDTASIEVYIYDVKDTSKIVLYPNPNNGTFTIEGLMNNDGVIPIAVYSSIGLRVHKQDMTPVNRVLSETITLEGKLFSGVYFAELFVNGKTIVIPFTIVR